MYDSAAGMTFAFSNTYGTAATISAFTNANPGVMTLSASHGIAANELFVITTNGWGIVEETIRRASAVATNDVTVEGLNTTSTTRFPAGSGTGTVKEITTWTPINGIIGIAVSGDEQSFETVTPYDKGGGQIQIPTERSPFQVQLTFSHNATAQSWYTSLRDLDENKTKISFRAVYPGGMRFFVYGFVTVQEGPQQDGLNSPKGVITVSGFRTLYGT